MVEVPRRSGVRGCHRCALEALCGAVRVHQAYLGLVPSAQTEAGSVFVVVGEEDAGRPHSGAMLKTAARSAEPRAVTPGPQNSTNLFATL